MKDHYFNGVLQYFNFATWNLNEHLVVFFLKLNEKS